MASTTRPPDPLIVAANSTRLHYATGELLGADDFQDEQTYHRRQLARALLHLHGSGTIAGLRVVPQHRPGARTEEDEVELDVLPGLALDHAGRLIEVPRQACLRLRRWYTFIADRAPSSEELDASDLRAAWRADAAIPAGGAVVADVFVTFHECDTGYTPAFASGPFDALDASQPSRVRDGYELSLILRTERDADLREAFDPWAGIAGATLEQRLQSAERISFGLWDRLSQPMPENPVDVDATAVLLARLRIPAGQNPAADRAPIPDWSATAWPDENANINNRVRHILLPPGAVRFLIAP
jgi:hypothetical protein